MFCFILIPLQSLITFDFRAVGLMKTMLLMILHKLVSSFGTGLSYLKEKTIKVIQRPQLNPRAGGTQVWFW